ncbi:hypothetical protein L226DRAFT_40345 [Lentinus tigrinus ALCF2SS1-7]|uniref:Uncharacterized protein n=1 Tax=Lentinus tigrinus ALCF2SS1-6 TaxID=1328759 RepID=A0A5C2SLW1_9APHY|nr:hypothetical protein L227DRAFT_262129 [Lentinus tigrinus ALCF2SS1-6]RPD82901.1 hypothetical protein L226DRAFT_40345 [Lentinus tigrinus ALCF2SS1-7]
MGDGGECGQWLQRARSHHPVSQRHGDSLPYSLDVCICRTPHAARVPIHRRCAGRVVRPWVEEALGIGEAPSIESIAMPSGPHCGRACGVTMRTCHRRTSRSRHTHSRVHCAPRALPRRELLPLWPDHWHLAPGTTHFHIVRTSASLMWPSDFAIAGVQTFTYID